MNYYVVATKYDNDAGEVVPYVAGQFPDFNLAQIFQAAYNERYQTDARVYHESYLLRFGATMTMLSINKEND